MEKCPICQGEFKELTKTLNIPRKGEVKVCEDCFDLCTNLEPPEPVGKTRVHCTVCYEVHQVIDKWEHEERNDVTDGVCSFCQELGLD